MNRIAVMFLKDGNAFWYNILPNGEWVNFDMKGSKLGDTFAGANYDHRDTRYAYVNLKDIIKKNYKDKSTKWWKEYSHIITFVIVAFIFILGCWILLAKMGNVVKMLGPIADNMRIAADTMSQAAVNCKQINSGLI